MSKSIFRSSSERFTVPVPYDVQKSRKTYLTSVSRDPSGEVVYSEDCVEDAMSKIIQINFRELVLSNLVDKGIDPHGLDMIDTNRLGVDAGALALYHHLVDNSHLYVNNDIVDSSKD